MKEAFSVKLQTVNRFFFFFFFFCLKFKQNLGCPNKEYNVLFKNINQNIRVYRRSKKKSELIKDSENVLAYWKESEQSESLA